MALTLEKCPACGADLNLETDRDYFYCPYCGSKVANRDQRIIVEHVLRTVDEAKVKKTELQRAKVEAEVEKKRIEADRQKNSDKVVVPLVFLYVFMFAALAKAPPVVYVAIAVVAGVVAFRYTSKGKRQNKHDNEDVEPFRFTD